MKVRLLISLLIAFMSLPARAADLTGKWVGALIDPAGIRHDITLDLKAYGQKVTGTMTGAPPDGAEQPIRNGKFDGRQLSFELQVAPAPGADPIVVSFKGEIAGNRITGTHESPMGETPWEVTRTSEATPPAHARGPNPHPQAAIKATKAAPPAGVTTPRHTAQPGWNPPADVKPGEIFQREVPPDTGESGPSQTP